MSTAETAADALAVLVSAEQLLDSGRINEASLLFRRAESLGAAADRCSAGRWMCAMHQGRFESAWCESDQIRERGGSDPHRFWNGQSITGRRVIVRCLHGLGDSVQMMQYATALKSRCKSVVYEVPPSLVEIARWFDGVESVITWGEGAPTVAPEWDLQLEITELPYLFRTGISDLPLAVNYLRVPELGPVVHTGAAARVGLVWAAGDWNPSRSLPFCALEELTRISGPEFWNLQGGMRQSEWDWLPNALQLRDSRIYGSGLEVLARIMRRMDLVITVDTLAAHLAGSMGVQGWVLLRHVADWRWMQDRPDSPWYPSLRLYRQPRAGDWRSVIQTVRRDLSDWLRDRERGEHKNE